MDRYNSFNWVAGRARFAVLFILLLFLVIALFAAGVYPGIEYNILQNEFSYIQQSMSPVLFIALMITLPAAGFPISVFLVMSGIKFGIPFAVLLWLLVLPVHAMLGYYLSGKLRKTIKRISEKRGYHVPSVPEHSTAIFSFLFYAIPGLPYALKNYLLPLAGVPFSYCVFMNSIVQAPQGIPFIILGNSVIELDPRMFFIALIMFTMLYIGLRWLKKKYWNTIHGS